MVWDYLQCFLWCDTEAILRLHMDRRGPILRKHHMCLGAVDPKFGASKAAVNLDEIVDFLMDDR